MRWTAADIPDLTGRIVLVTGANSGLGFEATKALERRHHAHGLSRSESLPDGDVLAQYDPHQPKAAS